MLLYYLKVWLFLAWLNAKFGFTFPRERFTFFILGIEDRPPSKILFCSDFLSEPHSYDPTRFGLARVSWLFCRLWNWSWLLTNPLPILLSPSSSSLIFMNWLKTLSGRRYFLVKIIFFIMSSHLPRMADFISMRFSLFKAIDRCWTCWPTGLIFWGSESTDRVCSKSFWLFLVDT